MVRFAMLNAGRIAMVLIVFGVWGTMAAIAKAVVQPVYGSGLITLRTATKSKRRAKLSRVVATPWIYTTVFLLMITVFTGMGILMKDTADFFGFQQHILSWEYIIHPRYAALLCACALVGGGTAVATFHANTRGSPISPDQFDRAWERGFAAYMGTGVAGFLFALVLEAARSSPEKAATMPGGAAVAKAVAIVVASRSPMKLVSGKRESQMKDVINALMSRLRIDAATLDRIKTFAHTLPNRADDSSKSVEQRMLARGFDPETARAARDQVNELRAAALRRDGARSRAALDELGVGGDGKESVVSRRAGGVSEILSLAGRALESMTRRP